MWIARPSRRPQPSCQSIDAASDPVHTVAQVDRTPCRSTASTRVAPITRAHGRFASAANPMARGARLRTPPAMWGAPAPHSPSPRVDASLRLRPLKQRHPLRIARLCPQDRLRVVRAPSLEHDAELESAVPQWPILLEEHAMRFRELARSTALLRIGKRFRLGPKEATPLFEQLARVHLEPQSQLWAPLLAAPSR